MSAIRVFQEGREEPSDQGECADNIRRGARASRRSAKRDAIRLDKMSSSPFAGWPAFHSTTIPMTTDTTEAPNTASLAAMKSLSLGRAWPAMNSDMVKPIPANAPAPMSCSQE